MFPFRQYFLFVLLFDVIYSLLIKLILNKSHILLNNIFAALSAVMGDCSALPYVCAVPLTLARLLYHHLVVQ